MTSWLRRLFKVSMWLAMPSIFWTSLEMYGLTLRGSQMLFFSIIHTSPGIVYMVLISVVFFIVWFTQNITALALSSYREKLQIPVKELIMLICYQSVHVLLLIQYETWSVNAVLRIPICIVGLCAFGLVAMFMVNWSKSLSPNLQPNADSGI